MPSFDRIADVGKFNNPEALNEQGFILRVMLANSISLCFSEHIKV